MADNHQLIVLYPRLGFIDAGVSDEDPDERTMVLDLVVG